MVVSKLEEIKNKMNLEQLSPLAIAAFERAYNLLLEGADGKISESEISAVEELPNADTIDSFSELGIESLPKAVMIKLNGGLGTSMGLDQAKSLLPAKRGSDLFRYHLPSK